MYRQTLELGSESSRFVQRLSGNPRTGISTMISAKAFMREHSFKLFNQAAGVISHVLPAQWRYWGLLNLCRLQALVLRPLISLSPYRSDVRRHIVVAWVMNSWLQPLTRSRRVFPIPIRSHGNEVVLRASKNRNGMLICSVHLPLVNSILRPLVDMDCPPTAVVSGDAIGNGKSPVWGLNQGIPVIAPDKNALLRAKTILRKGGSVAALIDPGLGDAYNQNIFRLIGHIGAEVVFATAELQGSGDIVVEYFAPPDPLCSNDVSIVENLQVLKAKIECVLNPARGGHAQVAHIAILDSPKADELTDYSPPHSNQAHEMHQKLPEHPN